MSYTSISVGYTEDVLEYIRVSVPKTMLADLKDSVKNNRDLNMQDKYGCSAVSLYQVSNLTVYPIGYAVKLH